MAIPADDGVSPRFWDEYGTLIIRETGQPFLRPDGSVVVWEEPVDQSGSEKLSIWRLQTTRHSTQDASVTFWVVSETESDASAQFWSLKWADCSLVSVVQWDGKSFAEHPIWLDGHEGNLNRLNATGGA